MRLLPLWVVVAILPLGVEDPKKETDASRLRGDWEVVECRVGAQKIAGYSVATFEGDKLFLTFNGQRAPQALTFTIDEAKTPRTIDLQSVGPPPTFDFGLYKFEKDRLTICYHSRQRPKDFDPEARAAQPFNVVFVLEPKKAPESE